MINRGCSSCRIRKSRWMKRQITHSCSSLRAPTDIQRFWAVGKERGTTRTVTNKLGHTEAYRSLLAYPGPNSSPFASSQPLSVRSISMRSSLWMADSHTRTPNTHLSYASYRLHFDFVSVSVLSVSYGIQICQVRRCLTLYTPKHSTQYSVQGGGVLIVPKIARTCSKNTLIDWLICYWLRTDYSRHFPPLMKFLTYLHMFADRRPKLNESIASSPASLRFILILFFHLRSNILGLPTRKWKFCVSAQEKTGETSRDDRWSGRNPNSGLTNEKK
jgi:hypothetical protein